MKHTAQTKQQQQQRLLALLNNKTGKREWNHSTSEGSPPKFTKVCEEQEDYYEGICAPG